MMFSIGNAFKKIYSKKLLLLFLFIPFITCFEKSTFNAFINRSTKNTQQDDEKSNLYKYYEEYFNPHENDKNLKGILIDSSSNLLSQNNFNHHTNLNQLKERRVYQFNDMNSLTENNNKIILFEGKMPELKPFVTSPVSIPTEKNHNTRINFKCDKNDIYCLCKYHPKYKECVCLAYPKSIICSNYCLENPDDYFCNPNKCSESNEVAKSDICFCKYNVDDIKCKCKSNPYSRECFCLKNPLSHLCNPKACKYNPNSLFCSCQTNLRENMCTPRYCFDNPTSPYCKCIVNPYSQQCSCLNDPNSCSKKEFMEAIVEFDLKIRDVCSRNKLFYTQNPFKPMNETNLNNTNYVIYDNNQEVSVVDPNVIFGMYYPPCSYNPDEPNNMQKAEPCIPFPEPPKPCKGFDKNIPKNLQMKKSCIYKSSKGSCVRNISNAKSPYLRSLLKNISDQKEIMKNEQNLRNVKVKFNIGDDDHSLLMLYNKILLFNQLKCQNINK